MVHDGHAGMGRRNLDGKTEKRAEGGLEEADFEVQTWRQVRGLAGAVLCETRDLGVKSPQWYTLMFDGQGRVDMGSERLTPFFRRIVVMERSPSGRSWWAFDGTGASSA